MVEIAINQLEKIKIYHTYKGRETILALLVGIILIACNWLHTHSYRNYF